jgi:hypothetical protein
VFPYLSGGITVACDSFSPATRDITFSNANRDHQGLLDGGHTALALVSWAYDAKPKTWADVEQLLQSRPQSNIAVHTTLVPITIVCGDLATIAQISRTKNRSAQVSRGALLNNEGVFDELRKHLPRLVDARVKWLDQDASAVISVADLANLIQFPLMALKSPNPLPVKQPHRIYSNAATSLESSTALLLRDHGTHTVVQNAVMAIAKITELYDTIQADFPTLYNAQPSPYSNGGGTRRFGSLNVSNAKVPTSLFYGNPLTHAVAKAMVLPFLYATVVHCTDPLTAEVGDLIGTCNTYKNRLMSTYVDQIDKYKGSWDMAAKKIYTYNKVLTAI